MDKLEDPDPGIGDVDRASRADKAEDLDPNTRGKDGVGRANGVEELDIGTASVDGIDKIDKAEDPAEAVAEKAQGQPWTDRLADVEKD